MAHVIRDRFGTPLQHWHTAASAGMFPGVFTVNKFFDGDLTTTLSTVWDGSAGTGLYPYPGETPSVATIQSTSIEDALGGTGAYKIDFQGVDENWNLVTEVLELSGTTPVVGTQLFKRIFRAFCRAPVGSNLSNVGTITATLNGTLATQIRAGEGQTQQSMYTVPAGYTAYLYIGTLSVPKGQSIYAEFMVRENNGDGRGPWRIAHAFETYQNLYSKEFIAPAVLPEKYDMELRGTADAGTIHVHGSYDLILIPNDYSAE